MNKQKPFVKMAGRRRVPLYDMCTLTVLLTNDTVVAQQRLPADKFPGVAATECSAICVNYRGQFALIFDVRELDHEIIAHEIFHATIAVADWCNMRLAVDNNEPYAFLCGWITQYVYTRLKKCGVRVKRASWLEDA